MTRQVLSRWFAGIGRETATLDESSSPKGDAGLRRAVDALPIVIFEFDTSGMYTFVAGGHVALFGIHPAQLVGRSVFDFPKFVPGKNLMARRALAGETLSFTGIWPRGRFIIQFVPRRAPDGTVVAVVGLGFELTKPKANDAHFEGLLEALRQSEARFRVMCDGAPLGICVCDPQLELGYANAALCMLLGRTPEELLGRGWQTALPSEHVSALRTFQATAAPERLFDAGVLRLLHKDGSSVFTSLRMAAMYDEGVLLGYVITIADVSQEHHARLATERARLDLRRMIENSPEGIAVLRESRCLFANRALVTALGLANAEQLIGRGFGELVHPEDRVWVHESCRAGTTSALDAAGFELRCLRADGSYALLEVRVAELDEFDGAPATLLSARDITETKRLRAQLLVSERLSSVGSLAAGVAHEINNPLAAALLHLDWLAAQLTRLNAAQPALSESELRAQLRRLVKPVEEAREAGARVRDIVRDLNVFSRPEDERQEPVDLSRVLESAVRLAWNELRQRARLVRDWGELPSVRGSEARLGQVVLNLLINAAQAIEERRPEAHEIRVSARVLSSTHVLVEVCDTGSGIPAENLERIFDPFFTTKPPGIGTGLGLSICQRLTASMGGQIEVESRVGHGSTFRVTLLRADPEPEPAAASHHTPIRTEAAPRGRLMVIDDDEAMGGALEQMLTPEHSVQVFVSARTALASLQAGSRVDLVLCDVMMPDMSGIEFHSALQRSHPELARRVVFVTGGTLNAQARSFLDRVDNPRLYKPFEAAKLHRLVSSQLTAALDQAR